MKTAGIMRRARRRIFVLVTTTLVVPVFAQSPPPNTNGNHDQDLDVTLQVIVDPNAKVPDEIVRRIALPKPQPAATGDTPQSDNSSGADDKGKDKADKSHGQGRDFGQQTAEQAKQRADEARRNNGKGNGPPDKPPKPPKPPGPAKPAPHGAG